MKKLLFILIVLGTMSSCNLSRHFDARFHIGMSEQEFRLANKSADQVYGDDRGITIFRTYNAYATSYKFFLFDKEKLVRFEDGKSENEYKLMRM